MGVSVCGCVCMWGSVCWGGMRERDRERERERKRKSSEGEKQPAKKERKKKERKKERRSIVSVTNTISLHHLSRA